MLLVNWAIHGLRDAENEGVVVGYVSVASGGTSDSAVHAIVILTDSKRLVDIPIRDLVVIEDLRKHDIRKRGSKGK